MALALAIAGCQNPPPPPPAPAQSGPTDPAGAARQAVERRDWTTAAPLLREAIARDPRNLSLHYNLAIAASFLEARDEAIREFQWVVTNAPSGSEEARTARAWLAEAGASAAARPGAAAVPDDAQAGISGRVIWGEPGQAPGPQARLQVHLVGLANTPTRRERYTVRTDEQGRFHFKSVVAGPYKLTNVIAGPPIWRLRIELKAGGETSLDLTPDNTVKARDDFPDDKAKPG